MIYGKNRDKQNKCVFKSNLCFFFQVKCGMRGHLGPACNAVGYVDREVWGINHLYSQPEWRRLKVQYIYNR